MFVKHKCLPIMTNSKYGQGHMDKYLETSLNILSKEMLMWNIKALGLGVQKVINKVKQVIKMVYISKSRQNHGQGQG